MPYDTLLVDNDNTLMDFNAAERQALSLTLTTFGLPADDAVCHVYHEINDACWKALERGETTQAKLKLDRFRLFLEAIGRADVPYPEVAAFYAEHLGDYSDLLPGALELVQALHGKMKLVLVSNGISRIQRSRLARCPITPYLDEIVISEEIGVSKPDPRMLEIALERAGCTDRRRAVMLGDSASADIAAACAAGIDSIYLDRFGKPCGRETYRVESVEEAKKLLLTLC